MRKTTLPHRGKTNQFVQGWRLLSPTPRIHPDVESRLQAEGDIPTDLLNVRIAPTTSTNRIYCSLIRRSPNVMDIVKLVRIDE